MNQPALGKKILELRKSKGLTQEDLVDLCNISVRTIQRIEAGEVTPRSFTVKNILEALDYDISQLQNEESKIESNIKKALLLKVDSAKEAKFITNQLTIAWISGIVFLILGFIEVPADYYRIFEGENILPPVIYAIIKIFILGSIILFIRGFVLTGTLLQNYLLKITAFLFIATNIVFYGYDIASLFFEFDLNEAFIGAHSITLGIIGVLLGIAVLRLNKVIGTIATVTGVFEIVTFGLMSTVILSIGGLILWIPTLILEVILLYKVTSLLKNKIEVL